MFYIIIVILIKMIRKILGSKIQERNELLENRLNTLIKKHLTKEYLNNFNTERRLDI
jgi:hypothetical protein